MKEKTLRHPLSLYHCARGLIALFSVGALTLAHMEQASAEPKPVLTVPESTYDFGTVSQGAVVVHEFEVKNTGTADLTIQRLSPSCGCTATQLASPVVKPGTSEKVRVSFDTSGFLGEKVKTVEIVTNDTVNTDKFFRLHGTVVSDYTLEPTSIDMGEIFPSMPASRRQKEVTLSLREGSDIQISKVSSLSNFLVVSPISTQGKRATVKVEILPSAPKGEFRDRVVFEVEGGRRSALNVPVNAYVRGDLRLSPSTLSFGVVEGQTVLERRIQFENKGAQPVKIESVSSSDPAVSASFLEVEPGRQGVLVVKLDPRSARGDVKATLTVKTDHQEEKTLSLNVFGVQPPR